MNGFRCLRCLRISEEHSKKDLRKMILIRGQIEAVLEVRTEANIVAVTVNQLFFNISPRFIAEKTRIEKINCDS